MADEQVPQGIPPEAAPPVGTPQEPAGPVPPEVQEALGKVAAPPLESGAIEPQGTPAPVVAEKNVDVNNPTLDRGNVIGDAVSHVVEKTDDQVKKNADGIPAEMGPRWELIVREARNAIYEKRNQIKVIIGDQPYQGLPMDENELATRYLQMLEDVELQTQSLEPNLQKSKDGRLLVNKEYVNTLVKLEKKRRKGELS